MKNLFNSMLLLAVAVMFSASVTTAQTPNYAANLVNDSIVNSTTLEFDVYLKRLDTTRFELGGCQIGLLVNNAIFNGGTCTFTIVAGSSQLLTAQVPSSLNATTIVGANRVLKVASKVPPGAGNGTLISNTGLGTRVGRFRLVSSLPYITASPNIRWLITNWAGYPSVISAYIGTTNVAITDSLKLINNLVNSPLPVELKNFSVQVTGRDAQVAWSTATEINSNRFEVERSAVAEGSSVRSWQVVATVRAAGTSTEPKEYSVTDKRLNGGTYAYRLKMVDNDGTFEYSREVEGTVEMPKEFGMSQNYPNPFNPSTRVEYQVPVQAKVQVELFSMNGERVAVLVNGEQEAGYYSVDLNAGSYRLTSGIYLYRMVAQSTNGQKFSSVKKMVLIK